MCFVNDKIGYINDRYFALFVSLFVCRQIQLFILWPFLTWCLLKGFGKSLQTVLLDVGEACMFDWIWLLGRALCAYTWEEILVVWSHRGEEDRFSCKIRDYLLMILPQVVLWGTSVPMFFWRAIKDYMSAFVMQNKSNVLDKMVAVSALLTKLLMLEQHSFATPSGSLHLPFSCSSRIIVILKKENVIGMSDQRRKRDRAGED